MVETRCAMLRSRCWMGVSRKGGEGARAQPPVLSGHVTTERRREAGVEVDDDAGNEVVDAAAGVGVVDAAGIGAANGAGMGVVEGAGIGTIDETGIGIDGGAGMGVVDDGGRQETLGFTSSTSNVVLVG